MEQTGVRIDPAVLNDMSSRLAVDIDTLAERIYAALRPPLQHQLPQAARRDPSSTRWASPKPMKYGKGKVVSTAQDVLEELAEAAPHRRPRSSSIASSRSSRAPTSTQLPAARRPLRPHPHHLQPGRHRHRPPLVHQSQPPEHPHPHRHRPRDPRRLHRRPRQPPHVGRLLPNRAPPHGRLLPGPAPAQRLPHQPGHPHPHRRRGLRPRPRHASSKETRARAKAVNFGIVYGISPFGLAAQLGIDQKVAKDLHRNLL